MIKLWKKDTYLEVCVCVFEQNIIFILLFKIMEERRYLFGFAIFLFIMLL